MELRIGAIVAEPGSSVRNETGGWRTFRPKVDSNKCTGCDICWFYCPDAAITRGKPVSIDYRYCKGCGICATECKFGAITMVPEGKI